MPTPRGQHRSVGAEQPRDELDVAHSIVGATDYDELLQRIQPGTSYYEDEDLRLQMRSFRKYLVTKVAFDEPLWKRAVYETKIKLADEGFSYFDERTGEVKTWKPVGEDDDTYKIHGRTTALRERGEEIWTDLARPEKTISEEQVAAMAEKAGIDVFRPIFGSLVAGYNEMSKSREGRTQDNFFGRVKKHYVESDDDETARRLLGRRKKP